MDMFDTFLGLSDSPAETPTISVPVIVKAAKTRALITPKIPFEKAPGSFQYLKPYTVPLNYPAHVNMICDRYRIFCVYPMTPPEVRHPTIT